MSPDDIFNAYVGVAVVFAVLAIAFYYLTYKLFGIDWKILFYASLAESVGFWYDREEKKDRARDADRRRPS